MFFSNKYQLLFGNLAGTRTFRLQGPGQVRRVPTGKDEPEYTSFISVL